MSRIRSVRPLAGALATVVAALVAGQGVLAQPTDEAPVATGAPRGLDLNGDGVVGTLDLITLFEWMDSEDESLRQAIDFNGDGEVDLVDVSLMLAGFDDRTGLVGDDAGFTSSLVADGTKLEMVDDANGFYLILPTNTRLWTSSSGPNECLVTPTITLVPHPDGCDLVFRFVNDTTEWSGLGKITVTGLRMSDTITGHDFRFDGKPIPLNADNSGIGVSGWYYPGGTYSPVNVLEHGEYKVGFSLLYPILTYKHQVRIRSKAQFPGGETRWYTEFILNPDHELKYNAAGDLAPGESRTYTVTIRVARSGRPWQETLRPYKDYFRLKHGQVRYTRTPTPVQFGSLAVDGNHEIENPYGFAGGYNMRPDLFGFGPWVDRLVTRSDLGFTRIMVSKPTGQFFVNQQNNIPPLFTSHWLEGAQYGHAMGDAVEQFNRVPATGMKLALWWGRSAQVMPDGWDTFAIEDLNPNNPEHVALAFRELDLAYAAGARIIGLDAFRRMQAWDALQWLSMMKERAPAVRFVTEPMCGDVLHVRYPGFQVATRPASEADLRVETRHFLADYLNPGHEIWGYIRVDRLTDYLGHEPTLEEWTEEAERVAALGYIPCISEPIPLTPAMTAVESWLADE